MYSVHCYFWLQFNYTLVSKNKNDKYLLVPSSLYLHKMLFFISVT